MLTPYFISEIETGLRPLAQVDWAVNQPDLAVGPTQARMIALYHPLANWMAQTMAQGQRPASVAGDGCSTLGVLAGLQRASVQPTLIWFDTHGDLYTWTHLIHQFPL